MIFAELEVKVAGLRHQLSIVHGFRQIGENLSHLVFALKVEFIVRKTHAVFIIKGCGSLNGKQNIVSLGILFTDIMHVIGGNQRHIELPAQLYHIVLNGHFFFQTLVLNFQIEIPRSEDLQKGFCLSLSSCIIFNQKAMLNITGQTPGKSYNSLTVVPEHILVDSRLVVIAFYVAL